VFLTLGALPAELSGQAGLVAKKTAAGLQGRYRIYPQTQGNRGFGAMAKSNRAKSVRPKIPTSAFPSQHHHTQAEQ